MGLLVGRRGAHSTFSSHFYGLNEVVAFRKGATHLSSWLAASLPVCCRAVALQQDLVTYLEACECQAMAQEPRLLNLARQEVCVAAYVSWYVYRARKCCFSLLM